MYAYAALSQPEQPPPDVPLGDGAAELQGPPSYWGVLNVHNVWQVPISARKQVLL